MKTYSFDAVVIGSGAAGFATACNIAKMGKKSVCIVTEGINSGTSRNTGSDKQTYYKLSLAGSTPDSVREMADTLFSGGCVDGDNALCEAALSSRCFLDLCAAGVPFPANKYGEYIGYKTDHDPKARATSAGPLTSKFMTEALQKRAKELHIPIFDKLYAVEVLKDDGEVCGLLCFDMDSGDHVAFASPNVVLATGGPAGIYSDSVYPVSHHGTSSLALNAGAALQNMTEWQYGLASKEPRWNVSGTYMQVLPRLVSADDSGKEREFLWEFFFEPYEAMSMLFLKGYQWPFDIKKVADGSSVIDLLVYRESVLRGRRVYLDFTKNPFGFENIEFEKLSAEAYDYLKKADACFGTPIERLRKMNEPAIELYRSKGVDISKEYLEIALSAQHCNGGVAVNSNWESRVCGLYAVGEVAGTHGITRPGGSALNAGQVGALRAAEAISDSDRGIDQDRFEAIAQEKIDRAISLSSDAISPIDLLGRLMTARRKMSACAGAIRNTGEMSRYLADIKSAVWLIRNIKSLPSVEEIYACYMLQDTLTVQAAVLTAMIDFAKKNAFSRGSALYTDENGDAPMGLEDIFFYSLPEKESHKRVIQTVELRGVDFFCSRRFVRKMPEEEDCFEKVWSEYRERKGL
ncbi:MAG: FAD-binding protein [Clostridia bacterium]|nr:FAD-binding protein [Clostridia bacterium]